MKKILIFAAIVVLAGCSTTSGLNPKVEYSGFDNAKIVTIAPHGNACESMTCTGLGAQWNSSKPNIVILIVQIFNEYAAISDAELNIDGKKINLMVTKGVTDFSSQGVYIKESSRGFVVSIKTIDDILSAQRVWLRIHTPTGYLEDAVIEGEKDSKAYHALKRFMQSVRNYRS